MSHHIYSTPGFLVGSSAIGEANKIFHIFTRDLGMVVATAQGIRLQKSKLKPYMCDFAFSQFSLVRGKDIWRVTGAATAEHDFSGKLKEHRDSFRIYVQLLALLKRVLPGEEKNSELFAVIEDAIIFLVNAPLSKKDLMYFESIVVLRTLYNLGYIKKETKLEPFINEPLTDGMLAKMPMLHHEAVRQINHALQVSHI